MILYPEISLARYTHNGELCRSRMRRQVASFLNESVVTGRIPVCREGNEAGFGLWSSPRDLAALSKRIEFRPKSFSNWLSKQMKQKAAPFSCFSNRSNDEPQ